MAHYYFDVKNGVTERDHAGLDLASDDDAIARAYLIAGEVNTRPPANNAEQRHISVIREDGHEVTRVLVSPASSAAPRLKKSAQ
jgi:hypothetical protein